MWVFLHIVTCHVTGFLTCDGLTALFTMETTKIDAKLYTPTIIWSCFWFIFISIIIRSYVAVLKAKFAENVHLVLSSLVK